MIIYPMSPRGPEWPNFFFSKSPYFRQTLRQNGNVLLACCIAKKPNRSFFLSSKLRLVIVLPSVLTVPSWSSKASVMILSRNMLICVVNIISKLRSTGWSQTDCRNLSLVVRDSFFTLKTRQNTDSKVLLHLYLNLVPAVSAPMVVSVSRGRSGGLNVW